MLRLMRQEKLEDRVGIEAKLRESESWHIGNALLASSQNNNRDVAVPLKGFDSLGHYLGEMSAMGDIPHDPVTDRLLAAPIGGEDDSNSPVGKIHNVSIPLLVVHAFDDPLIPWRATVHNEGFMHPTNLVQSGSGNLLLLLTKEGGHVGWPVGLCPWRDKFKWMSDVVMSFAHSVDEAKKLE